MSQTAKVDDLYQDDVADDISLDDESATHAEAPQQPEPPQEEQHVEQQKKANEMEQVVSANPDSLREEALPEAVAPPSPPASTDTAPPDPTRPCAHCGKPMGKEKGPETKDGPIHIGCVLEYRFLHQPRCHYCGIRFRDDEAGQFLKDEATGHLFHADCRQLALKGVAYVRPTKEGPVRKYAIARSRLSRHNWKDRYFILSPMYDGLRYFEHNPHESAAAGPSSGNNGAESPSSDEDESFDPDAAPNLATDHARKSKGLVPLDRRRARLLTHPAASTYKVSSSSASPQNDVAIIFFDSAESTTEHRLLFQCKDLKEQQEWVRALEGYITIVDDPRDYGVAKDKKK